MPKRMIKLTMNQFSFPDVETTEVLRLIRQLKEAHEEGDIVEINRCYGQIEKIIEHVKSTTNKIKENYKLIHNGHKKGIKMVKTGRKILSTSKKFFELCHEEGKWTELIQRINRLENDIDMIKVSDTENYLSRLEEGEPVETIKNSLDNLVGSLNVKITEINTLIKEESFEFLSFLTRLTNIQSAMLGLSLKIDAIKSIDDLNRKWLTRAISVREKFEKEIEKVGTKNKLRRDLIKALHLIIKQKYADDVIPLQYSDLAAYTGIDEGKIKDELIDIVKRHKTAPLIINFQIKEQQ